MIREHRRDILAAQALCKQMIAGLSNDEPVVEQIEDDIEEAHPGPKQWKTRERMLRAVARPTRAATPRTAIPRQKSRLEMHRATCLIIVVLSDR